MKHFPLAAVMALLSFHASAQSITPEVIASAGTHTENARSQLSWTLGEPVIDTYHDGTNIITQGFHQTQLTVTSVATDNATDLDVNVYPNPTSGVLNISIPNNDKVFELQLFDMNGKVVMNSNLTDSQQLKTLQLAQFANAVYLLTIHSKDGEFTSSHRIQKTTN